MMPLEECCYVCIDCSRVVCRDNEPSPMEADNTCPDCVARYERESVA